MNIDLSKLDQLPKEQQDILLDLVSQYEQTKNQEDAGEDFLSFVKQMWVAFIEGYHHKIMSDAFNRVKDGKIVELYHLEDWGTAISQLSGKETSE